MCSTTFAEVARTGWVTHHQAAMDWHNLPGNDTYPVHICFLNTEPVLIGQDPLTNWLHILTAIVGPSWDSQATLQSRPEWRTLQVFPSTSLSEKTNTQACQVVSEFKRQKIPGSRTFFQPLSHFWDLKQTVCGMPLLALNGCLIIYQNLTHAPIQVTAWHPLWMLVDSSFHDFEFMIPVIGELTPSLAGDDNVLPSPPKTVWWMSSHTGKQERYDTFKPAPRTCIWAENYVTDLVTMQEQDLELWVLFSAYKLPCRTGVVEPGPRFTQWDIPRLLIICCCLYTQRICVCLDPWDVHHKHICLPPWLTEGR